MRAPTYSEALEFAIDRSYDINLDMLRSRNLHLDTHNDYLVGTYPPLKAMGDLKAETLLLQVTSSIDLALRICRLTSCMGCRSKRSEAGTTRLSAYWIWE